MDTMNDFFLIICMDNLRKIIPYDLQISIKNSLSTEIRVKKLELELNELKSINEKYLTRIQQLEERLNRLEEKTSDVEEFEEISFVI